MSAIRTLSLLLSIPECVLLAGVVYGWTYIVDVLLDYGYFSYLCVTSNHSSISYSVNSTPSSYNATGAPRGGSCYEAKAQLNLVYTFAAATCSTLTFFFGFVYDRWGSWITRTVAIGMYTIACLMMIFGPLEHSWLLYPAMLLFAFAGNCLIMCNLNIANLAQNHRFLFISLFNGGYDSSAIVFYMVKLAYFGGISLPIIFGMLGSSAILWNIKTFTLTPKWRVPFPLPNDFTFGIQEILRKNSVQDEIINEQLSEKAESRSVHCAENDDRTFAECLKDTFYWSNVAHISVLHVREVFFLGTVESWLDSTAGGSSTATYLFVYGIFTLLGVAIAPLCGCVTDRLHELFAKRQGKENDPGTSALLSVSVSIGITSLLATLFSLTVTLPFLKLQYISFVLFAFFRAFLYSAAANYVAVAYPTMHFGKLFGLMVTIFGLLTYVQYPMLNIAVVQGYKVINICFLVASAVTAIHPLAMFWYYKKKSFSSRCVGDHSREKVLKAIKSQNDALASA